MNTTLTTPEVKVNPKLLKLQRLAGALPTNGAAQKILAELRSR
ncbi:hypothetical protein OS242_12500 [Tumebacillus sp. DT12]|uniref:Uncharacterized protein n=1 Tax=Tumebacillus lacus TaxID=2995335 RepID=A0ABT3X1K5_9BACL|nr:hypothetical protein [Tumebacillus lacus]MCX7570779.1 hypothetical protein [Tumebacillus lacus]